MFRTLLLTAALGALASSAVAGTSITVNLAGLDAKEAHAAIFHAAQVACRVEMRDDTALVQFYERPDCINDAIARTEAHIATAGTEQTHLASR